MSHRFENFIKHLIRIQNLNIIRVLRFNFGLGDPKSMFVGGSVALLRSCQPPRLGWSDHPHLVLAYDWPTNLKTVKRVSQPKAVRREIAGKAQAKRIRFDPLFQTRHSLELTTLLFVFLFFFFLYVCFGISLLGIILLCLYLLCYKLNGTRQNII